MKVLLATALVSLLPFSSALECSKNDILNKYRVNEFSIGGVSVQDTPPSETKENWWLNICDEHDSKSSIPDQCNVKDIFCGVTSVALPGKESIVTKVMDFTSSVALEVKETAEALSIRLSGAAWGSHILNADIYLQCQEKGSGSLKESSWTDEQNVKLVFSGPFGCLKKGNDNKDGNGDNDNNDKDGDDSDKKPHDGDKNGSKPKGGAGLGSWLVWLFMYATIFALIYLVVTSYMNTRNGSFNDFREEFVDRSTTFATNLPQFAKEVAGKIVNSGSSSQRGGYSAV
ncbi:Atg27 [Kluyveromyces lactis]|nr:Atg27 [Kluyveromyces lactis]